MQSLLLLLLLLSPLFLLLLMLVLNQFFLKNFKKRNGLGLGMTCCVACILPTDTCEDPAVLQQILNVTVYGLFLLM